MAKTPPPKRNLGPGRINRLNKRIRDMQNGKEPELAAAELAEHMRRYGLKSWAGVTLRDADRQANTLLYCRQIYQGNRYWTRPDTDYTWTSGQSMLVLYTPSMERGLVLRFKAKPTWPATTTSTGIHYMPRHPEADAYVTLEVHWHSLPYPLPLWRLGHYSWEDCCGYESADHEVGKNVLTLVRQCASIEKIRDAMVEVWQYIHGPATAAWNI